jgi:hypothetical protein
MFPAVVRLVVPLLVISGALGASTITFGLGTNLAPSYTFTRTDTPVAGSEYPGTSVTVPAGPYSGWLGANITADTAAFFCISFLETANYGGTYSGTLTTPTTQRQLEAAYLSSEEYVFLGNTENVALHEGPISMAIWQIMDPTAGDVPRDPAAQSYVNAAIAEYNAGYLTSAEFTNTKIFVPTDPAIQSFMMVAPSVVPLKSAQNDSQVPEASAWTLVAGGLLLVFLGRWRRRDFTREP